ncbi:MAG: hypothetical protein SNH56_07715 [Rikenellaceae bacterium]
MAILLRGRLNIGSHITPIAVVVMGAFAVACSAFDDDTTYLGSGSELPLGHNVAIMASGSCSTRTQIDPSDLESVRWSDDDMIALWAMEESSSQFSFEAVTLSLYYYGTEYNSAVFTGNVPEQTEGAYTYAATYPLPASTNGTSVTLSLPAVQSGYYDGVADLMFGRVEGQAALTDDALCNGSLEFEQLTHAVRIEIPEERDLLGATTKLQVTFPEAVVGDATINLTDENPAIFLSNSSNSVYIDFDQVISEAGYVWIFIAPTTMDGEIEFVGYDSNNIPSEAITTTVTQREMAAGHITPITLTIPEESHRSVVLTITENNLGEDITSVNLTAPSGAYFDNDSNQITIYPNSDGDFEFSYSAARYDSAFRSGEITVNFESDNAIVAGDPITLTEDDKYSVNYRSYTIPYLFEEDFSTVSTTDTYDGTSSDSSLFDTTLPGATYWRGAIFAYWEASSVAVRAYYSWWANNGCMILSLDGLTGLKEGKSVSLTIEFYADWKKNKFSTMKLKVYNSSDSQSITMSTNSSASSSAISTKRTVELSGCTSTSEITWETDASSGSGVSYGYDYIYMDNIKISIK